MSFVQREIDRISSELRLSPKPNDYDLLYLTQQALSWAIDPDGYKSPMVMLRGTQEGTEDCSVDPHPEQSSDTSSHIG